MQRYLARRVLLFFPTLVLASLAIFAIMRVLPGDIALLILSDQDVGAGSLSGELVDSVRAELGLDKPLHVQYGAWVWSLVNGEFGGRSLWDKEPLADILARRLPVTLLLTAYTIVIGWVVAIPMGVVAAIYQNRWPDYLVRVVTVAGHTLPHFWVALVLLLGLLIFFRWTPPLYYDSPWEDPWSHMRKLVWPALVLAWSYSSYITRVTRSNMLEVLRQDYVRTARSKGLAEGIVIFRHSLRNALIPVITLGGLQLATLLSGTVILEAIFGLPGIGQGIVEAADGRDYPVIQSLTILLVFLMLALNLLVDVVYALVDPRITYT